MKNVLVSWDGVTDVKFMEFSGIKKWCQLEGKCFIYFLKSCHENILTSI